MKNNFTVTHRIKGEPKQQHHQKEQSQVFLTDVWTPPICPLHVHVMQISGREEMVVLVRISCLSLYQGEQVPLVGSPTGAS